MEVRILSSAPFDSASAPAEASLMAGRVPYPESNGALSEPSESKGGIEYGPESATTIAWDDAAAARMKKIPVFVRGMVVRAVEETCRKNGLDRVTVEELERIRARMPTAKLFGQA